FLHAHFVVATSERINSSFVLIFFYRYVIYALFSSFPTRRSSDLVGHRRRTQGGRRRPQGAEAPGEGDRRAELGQRRGQEGGGGRDRKSTRLNSSHVKISYAVFCLKKKKKELCKCEEIRVPCYVVM